MAILDIFQCGNGHVHVLTNGEEIVFNSFHDFTWFVRRCQEFPNFAKARGLQIPKPFLKAFDESNETGRDL